MKRLLLVLFILSPLPIKADSFEVFTSDGQKKPVISDWAPVTLTWVGFGTPASQSSEWKRIGDSLYLRGKLVTGTVTGDSVYVTLPFGLSLDTTKFLALFSLSTLDIVNPGGNAHVYQSYFSTKLFYNGTNADRLYVANFTASDVYQTIAGSTLSGIGSGVNYNITEIPINGW